MSYGKMLFFMFIPQADMMPSVLSSYYTTYLVSYTT